MKPVFFLRLRKTFLLLGSLLVLLAASCGREAPFFAPGSLTIDSEPPGAAIYLNGRDTGQITPHTFAELEPDLYTVSVHLETFASNPEFQTVEIVPLGIREVGFSLFQTGLVVQSDPPGARIIIDGTDTDQVTPATLAGVGPGPVTLALALEGYHVFPEELELDLEAGAITDIPPTAFVFRPRRTAMLEGFSNVNCNGCPQMSDDLQVVQQKTEYPLSRLLYIKFSMSWPLIIDPHYQYNTPDNDARLAHYGQANIAALPTLIVDGRLVGSAGTPPGLSAIEDLVDASLAQDPGFLIDVEADFSGFSVPATVTLTPLTDDIDLGGHSLYVALVQSVVEYSEPPVEPNLGETVFHWVFRDRVDELPGLGLLEAGRPQEIQATLLRDDWDLETLVVIAFVQNDTEKTILQAGSSEVTALAPGTLFRKNAPSGRPGREPRMNP